MDTRDIFLNAYAVDQLPKEKIIRKRWLLITNCCPANRRGEHWVAIYCENDNLEFFDSFGMPPSMYDGVPEFIENQRTNSVIYNCQQVQSIDSDACVATTASHTASGGRKGAAFRVLWRDYARWTIKKLEQW